MIDHLPRDKTDKVYQVFNTQTNDCLRAPAARQVVGTYKCATLKHARSVRGSASDPRSMKEGLLLRPCPPARGDNYIRFYTHISPPRKTYSVAPWQLTRVLRPPRPLCRVALSPTLLISPPPPRPMHFRTPRWGRPRGRSPSRCRARAAPTRTRPPPRAPARGRARASSPPPAACARASWRLRPAPC